MTRILKDIEPKIVFKYFEEISKIPRGSGNEREISDFLVSFAKKRNLEVHQDEALNVIIKKNAYPGYEKAKTVILQGHMDMVCEKEESSEHDFLKDPIKLKIKEDIISGDKTTLGADNGIAVAFCLAILDSDEIKHPPLEILITTEEETGLRGAKKLDARNLSGKILINIDTEEESGLCVSCSGGIRSTMSIPIKWEDANKNLEPYKISISGLKGGHSGMDIDKKLANSNKLMGRVLNHITEKFVIEIAKINGGNQLNAIPRYSEAIILINVKDIDRINKEIERFNNIFKNEFYFSDPDILLEFTKEDNDYEHVIFKGDTEKIVSSLLLIPSGAITMSSDIPGLVESSTNLGLVLTNENNVFFKSSTRSSVETLRDCIVEEIESISKLVNGEFMTEAAYPAWEYRKNSSIRDLFIEVHRELYKKEPKVFALHAGLECGLIGEKIENIDMISFGPNIYNVHTPNEKISIESTKRTWNYLILVLEKIDEYF